jgi:excisionase family DNA binding protein
MPTHIDNPVLYTVEQAAEIFQVNPDSVYRWLREGVLPGIRLNTRAWRIPSHALRQHIENRLRSHNQSSTSS